MSEPDRIVLATESPDQTKAVGVALGLAVMHSATEQPLVIALNGELGAGKTTFVAGFLQAFGVAGPVRSPTYTLIEPYQVTGRVVYHLDLYRLAASRDLEMLALRDLLDSRAVLLVEWASRGGANLPVADVWIQMSYSNVVESASRKIELGGVSPAGKQLAASVQISADKARVSL